MIMCVIRCCSQSPSILQTKTKGTANENIPSKHYCSSCFLKDKDMACRRYSTAYDGASSADDTHFTDGRSGTPATRAACASPGPTKYKKGGSGGRSEGLVETSSRRATLKSQLQARGMDTSDPDS